jgi:integrase
VIYKDTVIAELKRNEKYIKNNEIIKVLTSFSRDLKLEGLSDHRIMFYLIRLRGVVNMIPDSFLDPSIEDLKTVVVNLSSNEKISPRTVEDYKQALRKFYKWRMSQREFNKKISWIKVRGNSVNRLKKSEDMITKDEIDNLIEHALNPRDKSLFSLLYDSGCRVGELLTLKIKDLGFDNFGAVIHVTGKTGERKVRIVGDSISYLREWINSHPGRNELNSWVFISISGHRYGEQMDYDEMRSAMQKSKKRAGITKRIHPHLFRHTRASILASRVAEAPLESQMGWIHGSRQTRTYVHMSGRDQDNAILKAYGIKVNDDQAINEIRPKTCQRCSELNPSNASYCKRCWLPFDVETAMEQEKRKDVMVDTLTNIQSLDPMTRNILNSVPEELKIRLLESILKEISNSPVLKEKMIKGISGDER